VNLIAVNLGNSRTVFGFFRDRDPVLTLSLRTPKGSSAFQFDPELVDALGSEKAGTPAYLISTVPALTPSIVRHILETSELETEVLEYSEGLGIRTCYREPRTLGMDRVMNAVYVKRLVKEDSIVVDVGTAATVDAVSAGGEMLGGAIFPGPFASMYGLTQTAAQLREIDLERPKGALGCSTEECIRAGILVGMEGAVAHLIRTMTKELGWKSPKVLFTGGGSGVFQEVFPEATFDKDLTVKGICEAVLALHGQ
jgi:type III pantothenate kinase